MYKLDLHTHSQASPDGSLKARDYAAMLASGRLHYIAVTDHDRIDFARQLHQELGEQIIVGQEITTADGELIGLYLTKAVPAGLTAVETARHIHAQGGLVYVPHPFETVRKGLTAGTLQVIAEQIDIIETKNGRALQNKSQAATAWAAAHAVPGAAASDAHGRHGWGKTYTVLAEPPTRDTLAVLLAHATHTAGSPGVRGLLYPKLNRFRKTWRRTT